jgi:recombination protein RecR
LKLPDQIHDCVRSFSQLPGVGPRTATRQVLSILNWSVKERELLAHSIQNLSHIKHCSECGMLSSESLCNVCQDSERVNKKIVCVVENVKDLLAIEDSGEFQGIYHVLGGVLNPLLGIGPDELKIDKFFARVKRLDIAEVILAVNPSLEGDATCSYIKSSIDNSINVERIGFGVPIGGSLEYLDSQTISKALEYRRPM